MSLIKKLCSSIKSKRCPHEQCTNTVKGEGVFCSTHQRCKTPVLYTPSPQTLNPLDSDNDTDPITLEKIYEFNKGQKQLCVSANQLFTYTTEINGKQYQRSLLLTSMRDLIDNRVQLDPFCNQPFKSETLEKAKELIQQYRIPSRVSSEWEQHNIRINTMLDKFQNIGYLIQIPWIVQQKKSFYISWINEVRHIWTKFSRDNPEMVPYIYMGSLPHISPLMTSRQVSRDTVIALLGLMSNSFMGVMIVLSALAWISKDVRQAYPDLVTV
jgi:hypothetical protein